MGAYIDLYELQHTVYVHLSLSTSVSYHGRTNRVCMAAAPAHDRLRETSTTLPYYYTARTASEDQLVRDNSSAHEYLLLSRCSSS
jgi:hypothetical protein